MTKFLQNFNCSLSSEPRGLGYLLFNKLTEYGDNVMQIETETEKEDTFANFKTRCIRTALHMKRKGLVPQDIITICSYNTLNSTLPMIASFFIGVTPNTLDPTFSIEDFKYYLGVVKPKIIFTCIEAVDQLCEAAKSINLKTEFIVFQKRAPYQNFDDFLTPIENEENFEPFSCLSIKDTVMLLFSSGTTGKPKAICLNHLSLLRFSTASGLSFTHNRILFFTSLYWISQVATTICNILNGFIRIISPKYESPKKCYEIIHKYKVSAFYLAPSYLSELCHFCISNEITLPVEFIFAGGAQVSKRLIQMTYEVFPNAKIVHSYGQTESGMITGYPCDSKNYTNLMTEKVLKGSCGQVLEGIAVRVVNIDTEETVGPYEEGEIRVMTHSLMNGYFNVDFKDLYDSEGWFKTGDIAYYDEDNFFYITGRCKEMLKYKSFPVSPAVLEEILLKHPAVKDAVVAGIPHEVDGDHPVAFVIPKEGVMVDADDIKRFVDDQVDDRKILRGGVIFVKKFPLTVTGKVKRSALTSMSILRT